MFAIAAVSPACRRDVHADPAAGLPHGHGLPGAVSFVVVVVGGMGSLGGAVLAGFLLGILQSFASMNEVKAIFPASTRSSSTWWPSSSCSPVRAG
jgi:branched-subunit amino acid ABC-type transport system permease component